MQLVHKNAADFNQGVPVMEAIALHMETFSSGLFEQILNMPYVRTREALDENEWNVAKRASIEKRYEFVKVGRLIFKIFNFQFFIIIYVTTLFVTLHHILFPLHYLLPLTL